MKCCGMPGVESPIVMWLNLDLLPCTIRWLLHVLFWAIIWATYIKNIGKFKKKVLHEFPCESKIFVYGWLYFIYNKYKHLKDNKYNFMKKN